MMDIAKLPPDMREAALMYAAGSDHEEAVYPERACHWCDGTGVDPLLSNRVRHQLHGAWYFAPPGGLPFADDVPTRVVRIACFTYDVRRAQGVILCPLAEAIEHCNDLVKLGFVCDGLLPKREWCCRRCAGSGEGKRDTTERKR